MSPDDFLFVVPVAIGLGAIGFGLWRTRQVHHIYVEAARRLELPAPTTSPHERMQWIRGQVRGVEIDIQTYLVDQPGSILRRSSRERPSTRTRIAAYGAPLNLDLRAQSLVDDAFQALNGPDLQLGDARFDRNVVIGGDPHTARVVLDATTRILVQDLLRHGGQVIQGKVEIDFDGAPWSVDAFVQAAFVVINLTRRLKAAAADEAERIRRILTADPNPGVRRATLRDTITRRPQLVQGLLAELSLDRDPVVRVLAARELGPEGRPVLRAALALGGEVEATQVALGALQFEPDPDLEPLLLPLLASPDDTIQALTAALLGRVGTAAAVEPLLPLGSGLTVDADVKRAARAALTAIRARLAGAEAGRLSLVAGGAGTVSVVEGDAGAVTIPLPERPR